MDPPGIYEEYPAVFRFYPIIGSGSVRTQDSGWEYMERYFQSACREAKIRQEGYEACISSITVQLLIHLTRACTHSKATEPLTEKKELLDELIRYIEDHLAEKITLKSAATDFYISERAYRACSAKNGRQLLPVRNPAPADCRKTRIINGDSLETIGEQVGFSDYSTFYRAFKQAFSISPQQFKKLQKA